MNKSMMPGIFAHSTLDMQDQAASVMDEIVSPVAVVIPQLQPIATGMVVTWLQNPEICPKQTKIPPNAVFSRLGPIDLNHY